MSTPASPIEIIKSLGGAVWLDGETIRYRIPAIPEAQHAVAEIRRNRNAVITALRRAETTPATLRTQAACWHCSGTKRCPCISCAEGLAAGECGECLICAGSGKVAAWVQ